MKRPAVLLAVLAALAVTCGGTQPSPASSPSAPSPRGQQSPASPSASAACESSAILPVVKEIAPDIIVGVEIQECQNGYARVFATPEDPNRYESEQVFLKDEGGSWEIITSGTGISCQDEDLLPELVPACEALGLR